MHLNELKTLKPGMLLKLIPSWPSLSRLYVTFQDGRKDGNFLPNIPHSKPA